MKVAVIGTGNMGSALAGTLVRAGHEVTIAARDADKASRIAMETGAAAKTLPASAVSDAAVVILAVPFGALESIADEIRAQVAGKVVVDVTNPLKPDFSGLATDGGPSAAEQLAGYLPDALVAKALNTIFASVQADPGTFGTPVDALFATDHDRARTLLVELLSSLGFRPVDAGPLDAARQLEAVAWLNMRMQLRFGGDWRSATVFLGAPAGATPAAAA